MNRHCAAILAALLVVSLAACDRQKMENEPRYETFEASPGFENGTSARTPPAGSVTWRERWVDPEATVRVAITPELLARGQERYDIYCVPCHGYAGYGDGIVVQRGFPAPPSYHEPRLRAASDGHFFDVMTKGYGVMSSYASRVSPDDRRAIIAYVRALQLSQYASLDSLPSEKRREFISGQAGRDE